MSGTTQMSHLCHWGYMKAVFTRYVSRTVSVVLVNFRPH